MPEPKATKSKTAESKNSEPKNTEPKSTASKSVEPTAEDFTLARAALLEITTADTIGEPSGSMAEIDGSLTVYFDTTMAGYLGWKWTVGIAHVKGAGPTVLETELTPGEGALLSPDWVPWSERLADYKEAQAALAAEHAAQGGEGADSDSDGTSDHDSDDDDDVDDDADDFDDNFDDDAGDVGAHLHSGDLDGVDIDSLDESHAEDASATSALPAVGDDKAKKAKAKTDDAGPAPAVKARRNQRSKKEKQHDEGE